MRKKLLLIISIVSICLVIIGYYFYQYKNTPSINYWRVVQIEKGDVGVLITATGIMAADTSVDVGVQVSGIIAKIKVDFNDKVEKGQVIAILDTTLYYANKIDAEASVQRARLALDESKKEFNRIKVLFNNKLSAEVEYDQSLTIYNTNKGNLVSAKAQLSRAIINLKYCTITAPISGTIISRNVQVGNMVIASFNSPLLFTIANDLRKMQVQANVDEADIGQVKKGQQAKFTVDAYPNDVFSGIVTQVRHQPTMVQNVVNYVVIIEVMNPDLKLLPGLTANSNIYIDAHTNVLKVASSAFTYTPSLEYIQTAPLLNDSVKTFWVAKLKGISEEKKNQIVENNNSSGFLWVVKGNDVYPIKVKKGLNDGSYTEIKSTLKVGETIATGLNHNPPTLDSKTNKSPFMPSFPAKKK